ncbi:AAA family ATPase [Streptomyces hesseae]|uniref:AAA family ATPase n=1 Tax=Streptomyces hesseae TaxID=3075519 RepID=A0ABU2SYF0_9ACTN|nr:AAA family ATPase [Streptomyces sp. DSM 40473]MDT0454033.1 AAA family ATPase [Streptomyces sp. DSM 40473]
MLLWINGPFGGGKTQTAHELHRRLPGSVICDPEHAGFGLHRMLPPALRGDFQDLKAWREGVHEVLDLALTRHTTGPVIVPMTIVDRTYFAETVGRLRDDGHDVRHFALLARRETVLRRLRERGLGASLRRETFAVSKLDVCLERLGTEEFGEHLWTDDITIAQVADTIAASAGLRLTPNTDGALKGRLRRAWTGVKHIRFD